MAVAAKTPDHRPPVIKGEEGNLLALSFLPTGLSREVMARSVVSCGNPDAPRLSSCVSRVDF
jgi:hypothetical protein